MRKREAPDRRVARLRGAAPGTPAVLELLGLCGLAVTQPVLDVFGKSPETFILTGASSTEIVTFALAVALLPTLALVAVEVATGLVSARARRWLHVVLLAALAYLVFVQFGESATGVGNEYLAVLAAALGVSFAYLHGRLEAVRVWTRLLAVAPPVFVGLFLVATPVADVVWAGGLRETSTSIGRPAPIVLVVFDELPTASLLDRAGGINASSFPAFAELAADGTWYRNNTTVATASLQAVPTILTGRYPTKELAPPVAAEHPANLFTLLAADYELHVTETYTALCGGDRCNPVDAGPASALPTLLDQAVEVWFERVPSVSDDSDGDDAREAALREIAGISAEQGDGNVDERFIAFVDQLGASSSRPRLDVIHTVLPHAPFRFLPDGRTYDAPAPEDGLDGCCWSSPDLAEVARQRHLLQLGFADRLLGRLLERLRELGTYDDSLIVVTADHGISFRTGEPRRALSDDNVSDILWTPFFVKAPGQQEGRLDDRPSRAIDVVPTIADVLELDLPWPVDGRSVRSSAATDREDVRAFRGPQDLVDGDGDFLTFDRRAGFEELLSSGPPIGPDPEWSLYQRGEFGELVGRPVADLAVGQPSSVAGRLDDPGRYENVDLASDQDLPVYVEGEVASAGPVDIVVAVNGVVGGWCRASLARADGPGPLTTYAIATMVPPRLLGERGNDLRLYVVDGTRAEPRLRPLRSSGDAG